MSMFNLSSVVKWTENVLESVDQKAASVIKDGDEKKFKKRSKDFKKEDDDEIIITEQDIKVTHIPKKKEVSKEEVSEKKLQDALDYTRKYFKEDDVVNMTMKQPKKAEKQPEEPKSEPTNIPDVSVEEGKDVTPNEDPKDPITTPTTSDPSETKLIEENKFLKQNIAHLHEEVQEVNRIKEIVSNKYKDLVKQLQNKEQYTKESQDRLENQVSRLLGDKLKTDTEFASALDDREKTQKQLQKKIDELIQQLKAKDSQVSDLQQEKIRLANESLQHQRHFDE
ncbi:cell division protein ZipA, partial [Acrasis kona]